MRIALVITLLFAVTLPALRSLQNKTLRRLEPVKLDIAEMKGKMATKNDIIATRQDLSERVEI